MKQLSDDELLVAEELAKIGKQHTILAIIAELRWYRTKEKTRQQSDGAGCPKHPGMFCGCGVLDQNRLG